MSVNVTSHAASNQAHRQLGQTQPTGAGIAQLVHEWKVIAYVVADADAAAPLTQDKRLSQEWLIPQGIVILPAMTKLPAGTQILSRTQKGGKLSPLLSKELESKPGASVFRVGIPWTYVEFIREASKHGHPYHSLSHQEHSLDGLLKELVEKPEKVKHRREDFLSRWEARAKVLTKDEEDLKQGMSTHRRRILGPKKLKVFREILQSIEYDDMEVVDEMVQGCSLVGEVPVTQVLDAKLKPARISVEQLGDMTEAANRAVLEKTQSCGDRETDETLWNKTLEEVQAGHLDPPIEVDQLPPGCVVNSRFPLRQGAKVRPIDNYSSSLVNDTVTVSEKPLLHNVDEIAVLVSRFMKAAKKDRDGLLFGKMADLKSAYRQLALSDDSLVYSYLAVYDPKENRAKLFRQLAVPSGSTKAVYSFLRVARALWTVVTKGIKVPATNYFDDFVLLCLKNDRASAGDAFDRLMGLLGWRLAEDKGSGWKDKFEALGVEFDLTKFQRGFVEIGNTPRRRIELMELIDFTIKEGRLTQKQCLQLKGRMQFAEAQFYGRLGKSCLRELTRHAYSGSTAVAGPLKNHLVSFRSLLGSETPRRVGRLSCRTFILLTDACYEPGGDLVAGIGGVLLTGTGSALDFFSLKVSEEGCRLMSANDEATIIYELETLGVLIGMAIFCEHLSDCEKEKEPSVGVGITCFVDNDASRYALIKGYARKDVAGGMLKQIASMECEYGMVPWFARVNSESNIADEPSRLKTELVRRLGFRDKSSEAHFRMLECFKKLAAHLY